MAAELDLRGRRKPSQVEGGFAAHEKRRLGQVHFARDVLHPLCIACGRQDTDGGRIAFERAGREGVDLNDGDGHGEL